MPRGTLNYDFDVEYREGTVVKKLHNTFDGTSGISDIYSYRPEEVTGRRVGYYYNSPIPYNTVRSEYNGQGGDFTSYNFDTTYNDPETPYDGKFNPNNGTLIDAPDYSIGRDMLQRALNLA